MTLPASGTITMSQIDVELGKASTANITLNDSNARSLAGVTTAGSTISMSNFYGKSAYTTMTGTGTNDTGTINDSSVNGTAYTYPKVTVSGGSGGYTYSWSFTSTSGTGAVPTLSNATLAQCTVSLAFTAGDTGNYDCFLKCVITDNTSHTITVSNVEAQTQWRVGG